MDAKALMIILNYQQSYLFIVGFWLFFFRVVNNYFRSRSNTQPDTIFHHNSILFGDFRVVNHLMALSCYENNYWYLITNQIKILCHHRLSVKTLLSWASKRCKGFLQGLCVCSPQTPFSQVFRHMVTSPQLGSVFQGVLLKWIHWLTLEHFWTETIRWIRDLGFSEYWTCSVSLAIILKPLQANKSCK